MFKLGLIPRHLLPRGHD